MHITKLVLIRHGESQWNQDNKFTGWVDIDLSKTGRNESKKAGEILKKNEFVFNYSYTSVLKRAIHTLWIVLDQLDQSWLPVEKSWYLNERHYGILQGLDKNDAIEKYGYETVQQWRRSLTKKPPIIEKDNPFYAANDIRYRNISAQDLPNGESLKLTIDRIIPYWKNFIQPRIKQRECIIVVAHGNSIRAIIQFLNNLSELEIYRLNIPTGIPLVYEFDINANPIKYYYIA